MDGMLPEEPGQPALSPCDVELTSETVRTSDTPVSSRLRSARCGSIASETNLLDHMSAQVADGGTCPSNSAPPGFTHAFQRGRKEGTPQAIIHTVTVQKPGIPSQRMGMGVAQLFRRPLGLGCYTDKMTDSLAPTT